MSPRTFDRDGAKGSLAGAEVVLTESIYQRAKSSSLERDSAQRGAAHLLHVELARRPPYRDSELGHRVCDLAEQLEFDAISVGAVSVSVGA